MQQNQRKDSASSEVAALLCISGRTSRISSVGSQGSAVSRLSAISGMSRSPSPHKMILETSFCGPKPFNSDTASGNTVESITAEELEQVILARKHDVTKAIFAEGIQINTSTPKKTGTEPAIHVTNGIVCDISATANDKVTVKKMPTASASSTLRTIATKKSNTGGLKKNERTIVGVTPEGTQYIRIKLKPDHLYDDNGLSANERAVDETEGARKPVTLSLNRDAVKKAAPHFSQIVQTESHSGVAKQSSEHLTPNASPKPPRHSVLRATGSRTPSPATVSVSRKSSFCSLFKTSTTESPTTSGRRKKSAISILLDSPRDRSRSKSRESDRSSGAGGDPSTSTTPSKQRSVLAIFKPKHSSKSSSPVDPEMLSVDTSQTDTHQSRKTTTGTAPKRENTNFHHQIASDKTRLRYYDTPTDGASIYIPLHTPPDEKENAASLIAQSVTKLHPETSATATSTQSLNTTKVKTSAVVIVHNDRDVRPSSTPVASTAKHQIKKSYRIELPDGSIRIPLRTPSDERTEPDASADTSNCSTVVQQNSSQESQETIISSHAPSPTSTDVNCKSRAVQKQVLAEVNIEPTISTSFETTAIAPTSEIEQHTYVAAEPKQPSQEEIAMNGTAASPLRIMTKERKRLLFSTKIGSGSEEQIFATQLSLSKTESLSSQLSEQVSCNIGSSTIECDEEKHVDTETASIAVKTRHKDDTNGSRSRETYRVPSEPAAMNVKRHSMYIDNIEEIMETQIRIDLESKSSLIGDARMTVPENIDITADRQPALPPTKAPAPEKPERLSKTNSSRRDSEKVIADEKIAESSESDHEYEFDSKHRLPRPIGNVEEESTGLVAQDSYEDDLPYIPTTLPEERTLGVTIIPVRDRVLLEVRTCPVDRPRSTTPLNPLFLEEYCGTIALTDDLIEQPVRGEKLRISLPRKEIHDACGGQNSKSPRRISNSSGKSWFEFAVEQGIGGQTVCSPSNSLGCAGIIRYDDRKGSVQSTSEWIDFDSIPEKRKPAKRITTLPQNESPKDLTNVQYNYVNPEECQCECHGNERESGNNTDSDRKEYVGDDQSPDDCVPLLDSDHDETATGGIRYERFGRCPTEK